MNLTVDIELAAAIELAMHAELEAAGFYKRAAAGCLDPRGKDMFAQLERFERSHFENLKELRAGLGGERIWQGYAGTDFLPGRPGEGVDLDAPAKQADIDALQLAIEAERRAQAHYDDLAARAKQEAVVEMFRKLSVEEALHEKVLQDQFYALSNQGHWMWGE